MSENTLIDRIAALRAPTEAALPDAAPMPADPPAGIRWRTATPDDLDGMHAVIAAADAVDHSTWLTPREEIADTFDLPFIDHARDTMLAVDGDGTVVAVGSAFLHPAREGTLVVNLGGAVHPRWRRRGIGTALVGWQRERALQALAEAVATGLPTPPDGAWTAEIKSYAEESNPDQAAIVERAGFTPERWFTTMERDMSVAAPVVAAPDGARVVAYSRDRDDDVRLARNDAFRDHWGSQPSHPQTWAQFVGGAFFRPDLSRLAVGPDGSVLGFCLASVNEDDWAAMGASSAYIDLIGVVRGSRRRGVAPAVIAGALAAIAEAGLERAVLDVDTASPTGANTLYEGLGFRATERSVAFVLHV